MKTETVADICTSFIYANFDEYLHLFVENVATFL